MTITLNTEYDVALSTALLGYVGETNARPVSVEGLAVDGADRYVLTIDYGDGTIYEVDITGGQWTPTADILRSAQTVSCQICAKKLSGDEYILVKKSRIFRLRIGAAIGDNAVPSPSVAADALDRIDAIGRQAHADMQTAVTAADTAQAVADSLPDDYVTAVGKIAENTAEIGRVKLTDKELQRRVNALYSIGQGITHKFETDSDTAYQKTIPTGTKLMSVKNVGGRSIVFNQVVNLNNFRPNYTVNGVTFTKLDNGKFVANGTATGGDAYFSDSFIPIKGHVYLEKSCPKGGSAETYRSYITGSGVVMDTNYGSGVIAPINVDARVYIVPLMVKSGATVNNLVVYPQIYDLTAMFGSGNEPASVEEFEKIFPAAYYPYNAGEIISAGTEEIVEQGANLYYGTDMLKVGSDDYEYYLEGYWAKSIKLKPKTTYTIGFKALKESAIILLLNVKKQVNATGFLDFRKVEGTATYTTGEDGHLYVGVVNNSTLTDVINRLSECEIMISEGDTPTAYAPFHRNEYPIPDAIKALPGYGWLAGTARNYIDYENKRYVQCVSSVDLGTLKWMKTSSQSVGDYFYAPASTIGFKRLGAFGTTVHNILCSKYITVARNSSVFVDKTITLDGDSTAVSQIQVKDTAYTDATAFKQAMQGVILYYELETPIVTDISSLIPDDFLRNLTVEAGGSVTFKGGNDDYRIPVPSEEEYIVRLSEVGGTT